MKTIHKYEITPEVTTEMPRGAQLLHVGTQIDRSYAVPRESMYVWALVDTNAPMIRRGLGIIGTGHHMPAPIGEYVGTVQFTSAPLVFHVFDVGEIVDAGVGA